MYWYYLDRSDLRYPKPECLIHLAELNTGTVWTGRFSKEQINKIMAKHPDFDYAWVHVHVPLVPKEYTITNPAFCSGEEWKCDFFDDGYCTGYDENDKCRHRVFRKGIVTKKYWGEKS